MLSNMFFIVVTLYIITHSVISLNVIFAKYVVFVLLSRLPRHLDIIFLFKLKMRGQSVDIYICFSAHALLLRRLCKKDKNKVVRDKFSTLS
jgi:hypothetical protein